MPVLSSRVYKFMLKDLARTLLSYQRKSENFAIRRISSSQARSILQLLTLTGTDTTVKVSPAGYLPSCQLIS